MLDDKKYEGRCSREGRGQDSSEDAISVVISLMKEQES